MNETSKAMRRRHCEEAKGEFPWLQILCGNGIDVGAGNDPVQLPGCKAFDTQDGDANHLSRYIEPGSLDYVHASQCLEHMRDPRAALLDWSVCVKSGGYLVVTVPSWALYEHFVWPSRFNPDHKSAWSMELRADRRCPVLVHIPTFNADMAHHGLKTILSRLVDTNYDYLAPDHIDQTWVEDHNVECLYEIVYQKQ